MILISLLVSRKNIKTKIEISSEPVLCFYGLGLDQQHCHHLHPVHSQSIPWTQTDLVEYRLHQVGIRILFTISDKPPTDVSPRFQFHPLLFDTRAELVYFVFDSTNKMKASIDLLLNHNSRCRDLCVSESVEYICAVKEELTQGQRVSVVPFQPLPVLVKLFQRGQVFFLQRPACLLLLISVFGEECTLT